jgi:membrane-bound serine protease (ClpP class)
MPALKDALQKGSRECYPDGMNMSPFSWYVALLAAGLLLILAEVFIPGGVAGVIGGLALLVAMGIGVATFPPPWGFLSAVAIIVFGGIGLLLWIQLFPRSRTGRRIALRTDDSACKSAAIPSGHLLGIAGEAITTLRPGGIALIDGKRCDVLAEGGEWIAAGAVIRVSAIRDGKLIVRDASGSA